MQTQEIMSTWVHTIGVADSTAAAAQKMLKADVGCLVVTDNESVEGVITDRDLAIGCLSEGHNSRECKVSSHMSSPAIIIEPTMDMLEAAHLMTEKKIRRLPVVDDGKLIGLASLSDIAAAMDMAKRNMDQALHDLLFGLGAARS